MKVRKIISGVLCLVMLCLAVSISLQKALAEEETAVINSVGPGGGGALYHPTFNPLDSDNFFLTCDMGSSFVTHDGGKTFSSLPLGKAVSATGMPRYWFTPHDENTVFGTAGTIVYVSYDKGRTWDFMFPSREDYVGVAHSSTTGTAQAIFKNGTLQANPHVLISFYADPNDPNVLYTMSSGRSHGWPIIPAEIYKSEDAGKTWSVFKTLNDASLLTTASNGTNFAIWVDQLQGTTAQMMLFDGELRIATHQGMFRLNAETGETIWNKRLDVNNFAATADSGFTGTTNMVVKDGKMTVYMILTNEEKPAGYMNGVYKSTDFGETWEIISDNFIEDARTNEGRTFSQHFADTWFDGWNITNVRFRHIAVCGDRIYVGYKANDWRVDGLAMTEDDGETWKVILIGARKSQRNGYGGFENEFDTLGPIEILHGDTGWSGITSRGLGVNPNNPDQIVTTNMAAAWMSKNGGASWETLGSRRTDGGAEPVPLAGEEPFWTTTGIEPAAQHAFAVDPFDPNHRFTGWTDIGIYETFNGGASWKPKVVSTPYKGNSHAIAFDPHNEGVIFAAYTSMQYANATDIATVNSPNAVRAGGLARSFDGGTTWVSSITGESTGALLSDPNNSGLPRRTTINGIVFDPERDGVVYVLASGAGVYKSIDGGDTFVPWNSGIALQTNGAYEGIAGWMRLSEDGKMLTLTNGGRAYKLDIEHEADTWQAINGIENASIYKLEMDKDGVLYATTELKLLSNEKAPFGDGGSRADIGMGGAWVSTDSGETWRQIYKDMYRIKDIVSDSENPSILYITSLEGKVYATDKGVLTTAADWVELEGFNFHSPSDVFENPAADNRIFVTTVCGGTWDLEIPFDMAVASSTPAPTK